MIIKSFSRKKSTKLYLMIITLFLTAFSLINIMFNYLTNVSDEYYRNQNYIFVNCEKDCIYELSNIKNLINITPCIILDTSDYMTQLIEILGESELNNNIIITSGEHLNNDEIIVGLDNLKYINFKNDLLKNKEISLIVNNSFQKYNIKNIINTKGISKMMVSDETFSDLKDKKLYFTYILNAKNEKIESQVLNDLKKIKVLNVMILGNTSEKDVKINNSINKFINYLLIANYIVIIILIMITFIINKNIILDLNKNINLEYKLGFNISQIKRNIFKRIFLLHSISFISSCILVFMTVIVVNRLNIISDLSMSNVNFNYITFILLGDLIMVLFIDKNFINERR